MSAAQASCGTPRRLLIVEGLFFPGYTSNDAARDLGDSAITETAGLGGFAMAAAPAIVQFVGGSPETALAYSEEMGYITISSSSAFTLPALDFRGSPAGIDCRKVLDTGIAPIINTGIAHREPGVGQIGAGIVRAPLICFAEAVAEVAQRLVQSDLRRRCVVTHPAKTAVIAVGGNALIVDESQKSIPHQYAAVTATSPPIVELIANGWNVVITHGNGPQVGFILRRSELAIEEVIPVPMDYATADTQGAIGYMFQKALYNQLRKQGINRSVSTVVTQVLVALDDPAFQRPTKPIGSFMDAATAHQRAQEQGWIVREDAGRGWRRVVPSPRPQHIADIDVIRQLVDAGVAVIACGGGGIPVYADETGNRHGVEAVVDKDHASSLLATELDADLFLIATDVEKVAVNFNQPDQRWLDRVSINEAQDFLRNDHFDPGSMGPKVAAMVDYVQRGGRTGIITNVRNLLRAVSGQTGTHFVADE